jgi:hypothetical protein
MAISHITGYLVFFPHAFAKESRNIAAAFRFIYAQVLSDLCVPIIWIEWHLFVKFLVFIFLHMYFWLLVI